MPKNSSGLPLKALGLHGLATVLDESITDWGSALEVPGGRSGTLLGSGALVRPTITPSPVGSANDVAVTSPDVTRCHGVSQGDRERSR